MHRHSELVLRDYRDAREQRCDFMSPGHYTGEHGQWYLSAGRDELVVMINYQWQSGHIRNAAAWNAQLTLHPTRLIRTPPPPDCTKDRWTGRDDKNAQITLVHIKTTCKRRNRQYPEEYPEGVL